MLKRYYEFISEPEISCSIEKGSTDFSVFLRIDLNKKLPIYLRCLNDQEINRFLSSMMTNSVEIEGLLPEFLEIEGGLLNNRDYRMAFSMNRRFFSNGCFSIEMRKLGFNEEELDIRPNTYNIEQYVKNMFKEDSELSNIVSKYKENIINGFIKIEDEEVCYFNFKDGYFSRLNGEFTRFIDNKYFEILYPHAFLVGAIDYKDRLNKNILRRAVEGRLFADQYHWSKDKLLTKSEFNLFLDDVLSDIYNHDRYHKESKINFDELELERNFYGICNIKLDSTDIREVNLKSVIKLCEKIAGEYDIKIESGWLRYKPLLSEEFSKQQIDEMNRLIKINLMR